MVRDELGSFDLTFLGEMEMEEAKAWLKRLPGIGPKTAGHNPVLLAGDARYAGRYAHSQGFPAAEADRSQGVGGQGARHSGV